MYAKFEVRNGKSVPSRSIYVDPALEKEDDGGYRWYQVFRLGRFIWIPPWKRRNRGDCWYQVLECAAGAYAAAKVVNGRVGGWGHKTCTWHITGDEPGMGPKENSPLDEGDSEVFQLHCTSEVGLT